MTATAVVVNGVDGCACCDVGADGAGPGADSISVFVMLMLMMAMAMAMATPLRSAPHASPRLALSEAKSNEILKKKLRNLSV